MFWALIALALVHADVVFSADFADKSTERTAGNSAFQKTSPGQAPATNALETFPTPQLISIPAQISFSAEAPQSPGLKLRLGNISGEAAVCFFQKGNEAYEFDFCSPANLEALCSAPALSSLCRAFANLGISAGVAVIVKQAALLGSSAKTDIELSSLPGNEACGGIAQSNVHLFDDIECSLPGRMGFQLVGDHLTFHGHGHSIRIVDASVGLFVAGSRNTVRRLNISGLSEGTGLRAYNADQLQVLKSRFANNQVGINVYSDAKDIENVQISNNDLSGNRIAGLLFNGDGRQVDDPVIIRNDFSNSAGVAISINAKSASFSNSQRNRFASSKRVLYLSGGNFSLWNLDLSGSNATGSQIFVENAQSLKVRSVNLSYSTPADEKQERIALHLYRVNSANIKSLTSIGADVGIKVSTERGIQTKFSLSDSQITNSKQAAIMLQSYDNTGLGIINIQFNDFRMTASGTPILRASETSIAPESVIENNQQ